MYQPTSLIAPDGSFIALKHIESMGASRSGEDQLMDKLKEDITFDVITVSGQKYSISVQEQIKTFLNSAAYSPVSIYTSILTRWANLVIGVNDKF